mgnify:CR=1 FL=1
MHFKNLCAIAPLRRVFRVLRVLLDELKEERKDHGNNRRSLEQHRKEQRGPADLARQLAHPLSLGPYRILETHPSVLSELRAADLIVGPIAVRRSDSQ